MSTNVVVMGEIPRGMHVGIVCGSQSPALSEAIKTAVEKCFAPREDELSVPVEDWSGTMVSHYPPKISPEEAEKLISSPIKYYRVTAYTPYCGEEAIDYIATNSNAVLAKFADTLCTDNAAEWEPAWSEHFDEGYETEEEFQEDYYSGCGTHIEEITEAEFREETKGHWPFELMKKGLD